MDNTSAESNMQMVSVANFKASQCVSKVDRDIYQNKA